VVILRPQDMKGCARSCLLQLVGFLTIAGTIMFFLHRWYALPPEETGGAVAGSALLIWIGLALLYAVGQPIRERSSIRSNMSGVRPIDGRQVGIAGRIDAPRQTLRAPFSGADCVAYKYEISKMVRSGKSSHKATLCEGIALIPSVITSQSGSYRLLAVPNFDFPHAEIDHDTALRNAEEFLRTTVFEQKEEGWKRPGIEKQWSDDDGAYRSDRKFPAEDIDLASWTLDATCETRRRCVRVRTLLRAARRPGPPSELVQRDPPHEGRAGRSDPGAQKTNHSLRDRRNHRTRSRRRRPVRFYQSPQSDLTAVDWASRCPAGDNEVIEVRQVQEISDFPADVQKAASKLPELQQLSGQRPR